MWFVKHYPAVDCAQNRTAKLILEVGVDAVEDHLTGVHAHVDAKGALVDGDAVDAQLSEGLVWL